MNSSLFKMPNSASFSLALSMMLLAITILLTPFCFNKANEFKKDIKVYTSSNYAQDVLLSHFQKTIKFGLVLIILMMISLVVSIITFVILTIRGARREMHLNDQLMKQIEATQQEERKNMNKTTAFVQANHDIRASLSSICGLIELCRCTSQAFPDSELMNYLNIMGSCTNDLLALLNSILDQSKIEEGKKHLKDEEFQMEELLEHVVNLNYPNGVMKDVDVLLDPCNGSVAKFSRVKGDRGEIRRILSNLLHNAVKFTSEGHITVRAWARRPGCDRSPKPAPSTRPSLLSYLNLWKDESSADVQVLSSVQKDPNCVEFVFEVDDTGKGIPKDKQKSVFETYVQVDDGSKTGTGLGLGISQSLVRLMGGKIGIIGKNIGQRGTCFRFNVFLVACDQTRDQEHEASFRNYEDLESQSGGGSVVSSSRFKSEASNVVLFIKEEERSRVLRRFMMNTLGLKVHVMNHHEQFYRALKRVKENIISGASFNDSNFSLSSRRYITDIDDYCIDVSSSQRRGCRRLGSRFILIIIDATAGPIREMNLALAEFRKDFPDNVSLRVVWIDKPGVDEEADKLPSTDIVIAKPLHGSNLYRALVDVPEFRDKILPAITQQVKKETIQQPPMKLTSPQKDVFVDVNGRLPLTGKKILLVEDDTTLLALCQIMVSQLGATIYTCENGKEALDVICKALGNQPEIGPSTPPPPVDYILMDCKMPEMDGFEATKRIREEEARYGIRIPIVGLTAHREEAKDKILEAGMDYYLPKPLKTDLLLKAIEALEEKEVFAV